MQNLNQNEKLEGAEKAMNTRPVACCVLRDEEQIQGEMKGDGDALRQVEGAEFEDLRLKERFLADGEMGNVPKSTPTEDCTGQDFQSPKLEGLVVNARPHTTPLPHERKRVANVQQDGECVLASAQSRAVLAGNGETSGTRTMRLYLCHGAASQASRKPFGAPSFMRLGVGPTLLNSLKLAYARLLKFFSLRSSAGRLVSGCRKEPGMFCTILRHSAPLCAFLRVFGKIFFWQKPGDWQVNTT